MAFGANNYITVTRLFSADRLSNIKQFLSQWLDRFMLLDAGLKLLYNIER